MSWNSLPVNSPGTRGTSDLMNDYRENINFLKQPTQLRAVSTNSTVLTLPYSTWTAVPGCSGNLTLVEPRFTFAFTAIVRWDHTMEMKLEVNSVNVLQVMWGYWSGSTGVKYNPCTEVWHLTDSDNAAIVSGSNALAVYLQPSATTVNGELNAYGGRLLAWEGL